MIDLLILNIKRRPWLFFIVAVFCLYLLFLIGAGSYPLLDPDEPVYGQFAKEMVQSGNWLTPHYNGGLWFDKPPMFYWLGSISSSVFGTNEFSMRLPSAVMGTMLVILIYFFASYKSKKRVGIISAIAFATCLQTIVLARAAVTDITLVFFLTFALYAYRRWLDEENKYLWISICGVMTGLGMLTKGPMAPVLLFTCFFIHLWTTHRLKRLLSFDVMLCIILTFVVGLPWFIAMYVMHKEAFVTQFLMANNMTRFLKPEHAEITGQWYSYFLNIPTLLAFFFPWSLFLPQAIIKIRNINDTAKLAFIWASTVFIFFSISKTQLVTYIYPLYPAAAILVGLYWDSITQKINDIYGLIQGQRWVLGISALLGIVIVISAQNKYPEAHIASYSLATVLILSALISLMFLTKKTEKSIDYSLVSTASGMIIFTLILVFLVMPQASISISTKSIASHIPDQYKNKVKIVFIKNKKKPSLLYYLNNLPTEINDTKTMKQVISREKTYIISNEYGYKRLKTNKMHEIYQSGGLILFSNFIDPERHIIK